MPAKAKLTTRERTTSNVSSDNLNKGSELSHAEADSNFINLRDQTIAISDGSTSTDIEAGETITFSGASVSGNTVTVPTGAGISVVGDDSSGTLINGGETLKIAGGTNVTTAMSGDTLTITSSGGGSAITVQDEGGALSTAATTFNFVGAGVTASGTGATKTITVSGSSTSGGNLGDLQVNGTIMSPVSTNADLTLTANGTGDVVIADLHFNQGLATVNSAFANFGEIEFKPTSAQTRDILILKAGTVSYDSSSSNNSEFRLYAKSADGSGRRGALWLYDTNASQTNFIMGTNADADVRGISLVAGGGTYGKIELNIDGSNNTGVNLVSHGTGLVKANTFKIADEYTFPVTDGSANQVLATNGSGTLSFVNQSGSLGNFEFINNQLNGKDTNADIEINAQGTGNVKINELIVRHGPGGTQNQIKTQDGYGLDLIATNANLSFTANTITMASSLHVGLGGVEQGGLIIEDNTIKSARSNEDIELAPNSSGGVVMQTAKVMITNLPTSDPTNAGQIWNDSGTLKISAG